MQHGEQLRRMRINLGLSLAEMAQALGWEGSNAADKVRKVESGTIDATGPMLKLMSYIEKYGLIDSERQVDE